MYFRTITPIYTTVSSSAKYVLIYFNYNTIKCHNKNNMVFRKKKFMEDAIKNRMTSSYFYVKVN